MSGMPIRKLFLFVGLMLLVACGGAACETEATVPATDAASPTVVADVSGLAAVSNVNILTVSDNIVDVSAKGNLPDGCTLIDDINSQQTDSSFLITITTLRPGDLACTQAVVPFEQIVTLDINGLAPGSYSVDVNGINASFTVAAPPTAIPTIAPTKTPIPTATTVSGSGEAGISGRVVHDICAIAGGQGGEPAEPGEGCIENETNGFIADGQLALVEPGLAGVVVDLGGSACPAAGLASTTTDSDGFYEFASLAEGVYCVSVAVGEGKNEALIPGIWTVPELENGSTTITVFPDETVEDVNFGWDFQFLPLVGSNTSSCVNVLFFVEDLTVPDDTAVRPGEIFVKTWRLQNSGSCNWTTDYRIVFASGEQMSNDTNYPLPELVPAGAFVNISLTLIAPLEEGTYRSDFVMADEDGIPFGSGNNQSDTFWVQIVVDEEATPPEPNSAALGGVVWADNDGDGAFDSFEEPIDGVQLRLSNRICPADGIINQDFVVGMTTTDEDGRYRFENLPEDSYCVSIAPFSAANVELLIPGDWTWPAQGVGYFTIIVNDGTDIDDIDFGWLYQ